MKVAEGLSVRLSVLDFDDENVPNVSVSDEVLEGETEGDGVSDMDHV